MQKQIARISILSGLALLLAVSGAMAQSSLRRSQQPATAEAPTAPPFRQEETIIRLTYTDPNPRDVPGEGSRDPGRDAVDLPKRYGGMAGALEDVIIHFMEDDGSDASEQDGITTVENDPATARVTITVTPDYEAPYAELDITKLRLAVGPVEADFGSAMRPSVVADLQKELNETLARIRYLDGRILTATERTELIGGGLLRYKLEQPRGLSVMDHHVLFNQPPATVTVKRRPLNNDPSLRFVSVEPDGRVLSLLAIQVDKPFYVEAFYPLPVEAPTGPLVISVAGQDQTLTLTKTEDARIWRAGPVLPVFDAKRALEQRNQSFSQQPDQVAGAGPDQGDQEQGLPLPSEDTEITTAEAEAEAEADTSAGADTQPEPQQLTDDQVQELLAPLGLDGLRLTPDSLIKVDTLASTLRRDFDPSGGTNDGDTFISTAPRIDTEVAPRANAAFDSVEQGNGAAQAQDQAANTSANTPTQAQPRRAASDPGRVQFGDTGVRLTPGRNSAGGGGGARPQQQPTSPLLTLIDRLGPQDPRVQALLADGVQLTDEAAAQQILLDLASQNGAEISQ